MAKPPAKPQKPEPRSCGDIRYRVTRERSPGKEDGKWYWRAEKYSGGTSETLWAGWATVAEADKTVAAIASGQAAPKGSAETVRDLLSFWLGHQEQRADLAPNTVRVRTQQCKALAADIGSVRLDRLDRLTLEGFRDRRLRAGFAPRTVRYDLDAFVVAWKWGKELGITPDRELPYIKVKVRAVRDTPAPSRATLVAVIQRLKGWQRLALLLLEGTGCRKGEITGLTWDRVDLDLAEIRVTGKTGERIVPISDVLVDELRAFPRRGPNVLGVNTPRANSCLGGYIHAACDAAGVPRFAPQGVRRAAVGVLYRRGIDIGSAAKMLGHSPEVALRYYREISEEDRHDSMERSGLGRLARPTPPQGPSTPRPQRFRRIFR